MDCANVADESCQSQITTQNCDIACILADGYALRWAMGPKVGAAEFIAESQTRH